MCPYVFSLSYSVKVSIDGSVFGKVKSTINLYMLPVLQILIDLNADPRGSGFGSAPARDGEVKTDQMVINNNIIGFISNKEQKWGRFVSCENCQHN